MEIIKQAELNVGWENIKPYISYLEFWKNKTDIELPQDCLFSITAYLGNICGLLNRDIRKKWLNIIGIHIHHEAINTLPEKLIAHVKSFRFGKPICRKKHILSDFEVLGQINFDTDRISKFKNLNAIWFSPPNAFLYFPQYQKEYLKSITELHRLVPHSVALSGINYYIFWDGGFRSRDQKETLHTYVARVFPEMLPEIKERLIMVNNEINTRMTYTEVLKIYDLINNKMGDYILFSDVVQNLETLVENKTLTFRYRDMAGLYEQIKSKEYRDINEFYRDMLKFSVKYGRVIPIGTTDTILDSTPEKINILISYHPVLIEYCNSVIIPVYNNLGIDIEIIIFGVVILTPYYNPSPTEGYNFALSGDYDRWDRENFSQLLVENRDSLTDDTAQVLNRFLHSEASGIPEYGGYQDIEEYQSSEINDIIQTDRDKINLPE